MHIKEAISKVVKGEDLSRGEAKDVFSQIMSGETSDSQIASLITALRIKNETIEEITGAAMAMREKMKKVDFLKPGLQCVKIDMESEFLLDTCGTGGSGINTFNISTASSFVVAGCNIKVAKHGNRGMSGPCGSADIIEALGIKLDLTEAKAKECLGEVGIVFLFAPIYHTAMKYAAAPRKEIGIRTIFNILGPLCNPASANIQVMGVFREDLTEMMTEVLKNLGACSAFVVHGMDGLDEITITEKTKISELKNGKIRNFFVTPEDFGINKAGIDDIKGGDVKENAKIILDILKGKKGPHRDIVLMNASCAFVACSKASDFKDGIKLANLSIDSGAALKKLENLKEFTNKQ